MATNRPELPVTFFHLGFAPRRAVFLGLMAIIIIPSRGPSGLAPVFAAGPSVSGQERDNQLSLMARQTLLQDETLAPWNLGVRVTQRGATLWGAVPSAALARRAESKLRALPGMLEVRSELRIELPEGQLPGPAPRSEKEEFKPLEPEKNVAPPPQASEKKPRFEAAKDLRWHPPRSSFPEKIPASARPRTTLTAGPGSTPAARLLEAQSIGATQALPARNDGSSGRTRGPRFIAILPAIEVPALPQVPSSPSGGNPIGISPRSTLGNKIHALQLSELGFQGIRFEVVKGLVYLQARSASSDILFRFAQAIASLEEVERVIVTEPRTAIFSR
jgi:hypothetical protein